MRALRYRLKDAVLLGCRAVAGKSADPGHAILLYHSVGGGARLSIDERIFARHLEYLAEQFETVRMDELPDHIGTSARPVASVTFDDGYVDNYEVALPILERFQIKGTFFLLPAYLGRRFMTSQGEFTIMSPAQARELSQLGHEIGAHTMTHPNLPAIDRRAAAAEMIDSKKALEDLLGHEVRSFAYPKGAFDADVRRLAHEAGFRCAVTVRTALLPSSPDWLALPRVNISPSMSMLQYRLQLSPALAVYERLMGRAS